MPCFRCHTTSHFPLPETLEASSDPAAATSEAHSGCCIEVCAARSISMSNSTNVTSVHTRDFSPSCGVFTIMTLPYVWALRSSQHTGRVLHRKIRGPRLPARDSCPSGCPPTCSHGIERRGGPRHAGLSADDNRKFAWWIARLHLWVERSLRQLRRNIVPRSGVRELV